MATPSFLDCVATVAAEERQRARERGEDAELIDIAYWSRVSQGAVSRFENKVSQPRELDRLLLAYAKVCGVSAASMLREAVDRWEATGGTELPAVSELPADERAARAVERPAPRTPAPSPAARRARGGGRSGTPDR